MDKMIWLTLGMMAVTYTGRVAGYWFIKYAKPGKRTQAFLQLVPGTLFIAMIAPQIVASGWTGWLAALLGFGVAVKSGNLLVSLLAGMCAFIALQLIS